VLILGRAASGAAPIFGSLPLVRGRKNGYNGPMESFYATLSQIAFTVLGLLQTWLFMMEGA
jgi:hypothetical protein